MKRILYLLLIISTQRFILHLENKPNETIKNGCILLAFAPKFYLKR